MAPFQWSWKGPKEVPVTYGPEADAAFAARDGQNGRGI